MAIAVSISVAAAGALFASAFVGPSAQSADNGRRDLYLALESALPLAAVCLLHAQRGAAHARAGATFSFLLGCAACAVVGIAMVLDPGPPTALASARYITEAALIVVYCIYLGARCACSLALGGGEEREKASSDAQLVGHFGRLLTCALAGAVFVVVLDCATKGGASEHPELVCTLAISALVAVVVALARGEGALRWVFAIMAGLAALAIFLAGMVLPLIYLAVGLARGTNWAHARACAPHAGFACASLMLGTYFALAGGVAAACFMCYAIIVTRKIKQG